MSQNSAIEWTDATWNVVTGCTKVSPACAHCYIERTPPFRTSGRRFVKGDIPLAFHTDRLDAPLRRRKPTVYFVNSLSDLFHPDVPDSFIVGVFAVMANAREHTFQVLTKRPERMLRIVSRLRWRTGFGVVEISGRSHLLVDLPMLTGDEWITLGNGPHRPQEARSFVPPNIWLGVSVENQHFADERIPHLLQTPAAVRFISAEPLLGPLDTEFYTEVGPLSWLTRHNLMDDALTERVDWVIAGGESGPRVRPSQPDWFRRLRDRCVDAGVPFFFKQWGGKTAKSGGRILDGRTWDEMPEARV